MHNQNARSLLTQTLRIADSAKTDIYVKTKPIKYCIIIVLGRIAKRAGTFGLTPSS